MGLFRPKASVHWTCRSIACGKPKGLGGPSGTAQPSSGTQSRRPTPSGTAGRAPLVVTTLAVGVVAHPLMAHRWPRHDVVLTWGTVEERCIHRSRRRWRGQISEVGRQEGDCPRLWWQRCDGVRWGRGLGASLGTGENLGILQKFLIEGVGVEKVGAGLSLARWHRCELWCGERWNRPLGEGETVSGGVVDMWRSSGEKIRGERLTEDDESAMTTSRSAVHRGGGKNSHASWDAREGGTVGEWNGVRVHLFCGAVEAEGSDLHQHR
jgi:hypothetical protein